MYHGEVNVAQEELNSFLAVAEDLKVKGLTQSGSEKPQNIKSNTVPPKTLPRNPAERPNSVKKPRHESRIDQPHISANNAMYSPVDDDIQEVVPVKSEPVTIIPDEIHTQQAPVSTSSYTPTEDQSGGIVADPNVDNSMYGDEYADYSAYEDGGDMSYGSNSMGGEISADGNKGKYSLSLLGFT